ncbi:MAG: hypothetical protein ACFFBD_02680 [Candidatus Hodarchaeota archaeon]
MKLAPSMPDIPINWKPKTVEGFETKVPGLMIKKDTSRAYKEILVDIFEEVKRLVFKLMRAHRAGLTLGLAELGMMKGSFIGGFWPVGSNEIIMNSTPLRLIKQRYDSEFYISYCYLILLHEYIHTLGFTNEQQTRRITHELVLKEFGSNHVITEMARDGIGAFFPFVSLAPPNFRNRPVHVEYIRKFDYSSMKHYS